MCHRLIKFPKNCKYVIYEIVCNKIDNVKIDRIKLMKLTFIKL